MFSSSIQDPVPPDGVRNISDVQALEGVKSQMMVHSNVSDRMSFKEIVANSSQWFSEAKAIYLNSMDWDEPELESPAGVNVVQFSKDKLSQLRKPWNLTLMGKCLGISVRPSFMTQKVKAIWKPRGSLEVIDLGKETFLFRFGLQDDYEKALFGGPWYILDHYLMLTQWQPNFRPSHNPFNRLALWIHLPELPVEYYDKEALFTIASKLGKPIRVDYATNHITRARYARVCVEINLLKPLLSKVWIGNHWQTILYENLHSLCFLCGRIGHLKNQCLEFKGKVPMEQSVLHGLGKGNETSGAPGDVSHANDPSVSNSSIAEMTHGPPSQAKQNVPLSPLNSSTQDTIREEYGPWTTVSHRKRPPNNFFQNQKQRINSKDRPSTSFNPAVSPETRKKLLTLLLPMGLSLIIFGEF